jgi:membrane fusion protein, multidrug efflux system
MTQETESQRANREAAEKATRDAAARAAQQQAAPPTVKHSNLPGWLIPVVIFALAGVLFFFIVSSWTSWESSGSVKTDDAYVRADVAPLATKVIGVVKKTNVDDFQKVKADQVLVELKNDDYKARVDQAEAAVNQAEIKLANMKQRKEQQDARVLDAQTALSNSKTAVTQTDDSIRAAAASIDEAKAAIEGAEAAIAQSQAAEKAAAADTTQADLERARQEALLAEESTTKEKVEQVVAQSDKARANTEAQRSGEAKARSELAARKAELSKALQQLSSSRSDKDKSLQAVLSREAELTEQKEQRQLLDGEEKELASDVVAKEAGLRSAQVDLDYTIIRAPQDGIVGELKVKPGQLVSVGTQVITVISSKPWVIANFRETQLQHVREGDQAETVVDALPGMHFEGHVEEIAPASGAQFSLLPPDNASGNFTKITQRIPVKIAFDGDAESLSRLRPGMSAIVTIKPGTKR